ncbi:hypothetical protein F511_38591 [Dorcoceras hygrometricum]|uniref:Uncharacterized protein n=1 Tax=Dorcoceras hygrometricum TaxID=472368 RepID=A0A2Z7BJE3_9LAMI|nr:hypothetical protein F511_38591 [Dorcoceras hygrometricum]
MGPQPLWLRNHNSGHAHRIMRILESNCEILSKVNAVELGVSGDLLKLQVLFRQSLENACRVLEIQGTSQTTQINDLKKGLMAPVGTIFGDLFYIKKKQREQDAKLIALDGQIAAIRSEQLDFQTNIAADILSLSTQFGDITYYIRGERAEQARRHIIESGQVISIEEAAERVIESDRMESDRLEIERERERRERRSDDVIHSRLSDIMTSPSFLATMFPTDMMTAAVLKFVNGRYDDVSSAEICKRSSLAQRILESNCEILSKVNAVELGVSGDLLKLQVLLFQSLENACRVLEIQGTSQTTQINDLKKGLMAPVGTIFGDLFDIKKKQREQDAKLIALDGQIAAIRSEQLDFQTKIAADILSLSIQVGDIADYIRGRDAKKGGNRQ